jgi:hypothetical protein
VSFSGEKEGSAEKERLQICLKFEGSFPFCPFFYRICSGWLPQGGRRGWLRAEVAGGGRGHGVKAYF